jgi:hypothetical protein
MATGTQKAKYQCSRCGAEFDSAEELRAHERTCTGTARASGTKSGATENREDAEDDMESEDRFEATNN